MSDIVISRPAEVIIEAELTGEVGISQILRYSVSDPVDHRKRLEENYWIDLCLTPRPADARACYPDRWASHRFDRIGDLFMVPPRVSMHTRIDRDGASNRPCETQKSIVCQIAPEAVAKALEGELEWNAGRLEASLDIHDFSIRSLLIRLASETLRPGFASELMLDLIASQIAIELARYCASVKDVPERGGLAAWRLRIIDQRLRDGETTPSISDLAILCNISVRHLSRGFRISRGCSIGHYVEQHRVEQAKRMLAEGNGIKAVAHAMGFSTPSNFSYAFRRATGISPARYRTLI